MFTTVLFDVDGVLLSEERYFDASALTVWEVFHSANYIGLGPEKFKVVLTDEEIRNIRNEVFIGDKVLSFLKSHGLNANWDMIYLTVGCQLIHLLTQVDESERDHISAWLQNEIDRPVLLEIGRFLQEKDVSLDFGKFLEYFEGAPADKQGLLDHLDLLAKEKLGIDTEMFGKKGALWSVCEHISQEWYVGDSHVLESTGRPSVQTGKTGFMEEEQPLSPPEKISSLFESLKEAGAVIGIGTGRPELETIEPFRHLSWLGHFDEKYIATADDVLKAERSNPGGPALAKPHPYTYLLALSAKEKSPEECLAQPLPVEGGKDVLIVGDSLADLLAARSMGCTFAAVLTGLSGKAARAEFEKHKADYILDSVLDVKDLVATPAN